MAEEAHASAAGFLSAETAGQRQKRFAGIVVLLLLVGFLAGLPFVRVQLPEVPAVIPASESALWIMDILAAILLFGQVWRLRSRALLLVAAGYLFDALMMVPHALSYPRVFAPEGLIGGGPQTTAWIYLFWHLGFPLFVLGYSLLVRRRGDTLQGAPAHAVGYTCLCVGVLVLALTLLTTLGHDWLPAVMQGSDYSLQIRKGIAPALFLVTVAALAVLWWRSLPSVLDLWLMVVLVAWLLDIAFSALLGQHRYDFGFYAGRLYGLIAASFVLGGLLVEMHRLHGNLVSAIIEILRSREEFAQMQRFEAIGHLVGGVAHDSNNILTVIMGSLELALQDKALPERARRLLEMSLHAAHRGERMNQQLLTFARRQVLRPEVVNPNEVITHLDTFVSRAVGETMRVVKRLEPSIWPSQVDRTQFETALVNLVVNARDAMKGVGEIAIETRNQFVKSGDFQGLPAGDYVVITVRDNGPGMPPDIAAKAFDPFFTTKEIGHGSGLGLSQVYGFATGAAGMARIVSNPGRGAAVEIYLPRTRRQAEDAERLAQASARVSRSEEKVLVVEDDPAVLDIAVGNLTELGYQVTTATDAKEALETLRKDPAIGVMFSDIVMPGGMNGAQLAVEARRIRPTLKVLLTSGYAASALAQEHGLGETLDLLPKPYRQEELARRLRIVISNPPEDTSQGQEKGGSAEPPVRDS